MYSSSVTVLPLENSTFHFIYPAERGGGYTNKSVNEENGKNMEFGQADVDDDELIFVDKVSVVSNMQR